MIENVWIFHTKQIAFAIIHKEVYFDDTHDYCFTPYIIHKFQLIDFSEPYKHSIQIQTYTHRVLNEHRKRRKKKRKQMHSVRLTLLYWTEPTKKKFVCLFDVVVVAKKRSNETHLLILKKLYVQTCKNERYVAYKLR